jgi:hypothetical protein
MQSNVEPRLRLAEFKALYKAWKTKIPWVDHLLLGVLVWLEEKLIDNRVKVELDEAIKEWETLQPPSILPPIYTEKPSATSTSLPEMRLTAPWYVETYDEK